MDVVIEHKEKLDSDHLYALHLHESSWWRENGESVLPPPNKKYKPNFNDESKL